MSKNFSDIEIKKVSAMSLDDKLALIDAAKPEYYIVDLGEDRYSVESKASVMNNTLNIEYEFDSRGMPFSKGLYNISDKREYVVGVDAAKKAIDYLIKYDYHSLEMLKLEVPFSEPSKIKHP